MGRRRPTSRVRGLSVVREPRKEDSRRWYWRLRRSVGGKLRTLWTGWATAAEAEAEAVRILAGPMPEDDEKPVERPETVRHLLRLWTRVQKQRWQDGTIRERSWLAYKGSARRLGRHIGDVRLEMVTRSTLERYRDTTGYAALTVRSDLTTVLASAWTWARERGLVDWDLPEVKTSTATTRPKPIPTPGEAAAVVKHLSKRNRLIVLLVASTGARVGEVAELTWDRVDLAGGWVTLHDKTGPRKWPLGKTAPQVMDLLRALAVVVGLLKLAGLEVPERVLGVQRSTLTTGPRSVYPALKRACAAAGVQHLTPHAFRRLASTQLLESGASALVYEALMGHSYRIGHRDYAQARDASLVETALGAGVGKLPAGEVVPGPWKKSGET